MRDPDGYLIEVGQYTQIALDRFNNRGVPDPNGAFFAHDGSNQKRERRSISDLFR